MSLVSASPHATQRVSLPTGELALLDVGTGAAGTVLLVPGYTGSKEDFGPVLPLLARAGYRCVAIDQRGQYESPGPDEPGSYTVDSLASDLLDLLDVLALERPHLVGHSFGGLVARAAVIAAPERFASLTLLGSGPSALTGPRLERFATAEPLIDALGHVAAYDQIAAADTRLAGVPELAGFLRRRWVRSTEAGLRGMGAAIREEPDRCEALRATAVPILVAYGADDDCWAPVLQADMAGRLGARHVVIPDAMHSPNVENPAATAAAMLGFWSDLPR